MTDNKLFCVSVREIKNTSYEVWAQDAEHARTLVESQLNGIYCSSILVQTASSTQDIHVSKIQIPKGKDYTKSETKGELING